MNIEPDYNEALSPGNVFRVIYAQPNRSRVIWTPRTLLRCLQIAYYPRVPPALHHKANRALKALWRDGKLIRRADLRRDNRIPEAAYMRPEDKPAMYFIACVTCGFPRFVRRGTIEDCRKCAGEKIDANQYWPVFTG